jgi:uncharacterized protein with HEPN domain
MSHSPAKLLADIVGAADAITTFLSGRDRNAYDADRMFRSAVERQIEILGEAIKRLDLLAPELVAQISEHRRIIAFRNIIAHAYDGLDDDIVWQVVTEKLPILQHEAKDLLAQLERAKGS